MSMKNGELLKNEEKNKVRVFVFRDGFISCSKEKALRGQFTQCQEGIQQTKMEKVKGKER